MPERLTTVQLRACGFRVSDLAVVVGCRGELWHKEEDGWWVRVPTDPLAPKRCDSDHDLDHG